MSNQAFPKRPACKAHRQQHIVLSGTTVMDPYTHVFGSGALERRGRNLINAPHP